MVAVPGALAGAASKRRAAAGRGAGRHQDGCRAMHGQSLVRGVPQPRSICLAAGPWSEIPCGPVLVGIPDVPGPAAGKEGPGRNRINVQGSLSAAAEWVNRTAGRDGKLDASVLG